MSKHPIHLLFTAIFLIGCGRQMEAKGADQPRTQPTGPACRPCPVQVPVCPDDYCPKKLPTVTRQICGCVCDYDCKKLPKPPCPILCGVNDYCPKKCPVLLPLHVGPWFTCGR